MAGYVPDVITHGWGTPSHILDVCRKAFGVTQIGLDPCANHISIVNAKTEYRLPDIDGLKAPWNEETVFCNPPYGVSRLHKTNLTLFEGKWSDIPIEQQVEYDTQDIGDWIQKCADVSDLKNSEIIALVPVATETAAWRNYVFPRATAICYLNKRLKFIDPRTGLLVKQGFTKAQSLIYWAPSSNAYLGRTHLSYYRRFEAAMQNMGHVNPSGLLLEWMINAYG